MNATNVESAERAGLKQKAIHEGQEFAVIFLYLAFFFCALATYSMLLLREFHVSYFAYSVALIKALAIAKLILLGEHMHLGKKREHKPLFLSAVNKAFLYSLLVLGFHFAEEGIKRLLNMGTEIRIDDVLIRSLVVFCTFVPLFGFVELRRVMGENKFLDLFFRTGAPPKSDVFSRI